MIVLRRNILTAWMVILAVLATALTATGQVSATDLGCPISPGPSTKVGTFDPARHPIVLVHGWIGSAEDLHNVAAAIDKRTPRTFDYRYFDYRNAHTDWAARPIVASCLAHYLHDISDSHKKAGGDGRVYVVAHSMGGLATRFATNSAFTDDPVGSDVLGGLTTIDTPHLGSPFGGTAEADLYQDGKVAWDFLWGNHLLPERHTDAIRCLALHGSHQDLPQDCSTAPYLPEGSPLGQISGDNTLQRTLFGVPLYDIDLRSDSVVGVDSSTGYLASSGPPGTKYPPMRGATMHDVTCKVTSDQTLSLMRSFRGGNIPAAIISAEITAIGALWNDSAVLDQINSGHLGPNLEVMLAVAALLYPCSHNAMLNNNESFDAVADSLKTQLAQPGPGSAQAPSGQWSEANLSISASTLGAVKVGMTLDQAQEAAGSVFDGSGDGAHYPVPKNGRPELYVVGNSVQCVGASGDNTGTPPQIIATAEGVRLGDNEDEVKRVYGDLAQYVPAPPFGRTPSAGYVIAEKSGVLAFSIHNGKIVRIVGGPNVTPSDCGG
ncbi:esterase/lipase family protein [Antrihabitans cavernicola]|uniref:Alpha/beta hydrolase n=1 Tax=Antrihabitans cavernicola TaxID=2495913 RepID=A0A5A7SL04_9NOCA|nr:alpha/beta fold hydrolase [Spelaeibacter cavernicola]KAA0024911.1 alpha/beta hydrolase [Spelaeibacter cavernicola]